MIEKKQVLTVISIALVSFLIGTTFNATTVGRYWPGEYYDPWLEFAIAIDNLENRVDSLNTSLLDLEASLDGLQGRVSALEEEKNQTKWIRFYEPGETTNSEQVWRNVAQFVWTPNNVTNNAILSVCCYFQYYCPGNGFNFRIFINEDSSTIGPLVSTVYIWSPVFTDVGDYGTITGLSTQPNQNSYTITCLFRPLGSDTAYVKDVNILIEVMDGLSASN